MSGHFEVRTVPKPWGHETIWAHTDLYVGKVLHIRAGHALSVQYHNRKDETIHVLRGEMIYRVQTDRGVADVIASTGDEAAEMALKQYPGAKVGYVGPAPQTAEAA